MTKGLGLNVHEWKYRISDPVTGRFWQVDPLAEDYYYNSIYAFQENKMGTGIELEGLELYEFPSQVKESFISMFTTVINIFSSEKNDNSDSGSQSLEINDIEQKGGIEGSVKNSAFKKDGIAETNKADREADVDNVDVTAPFMITEFIGPQMPEAAGAAGIVGKYVPYLVKNENNGNSNSTNNQE